METRMRSNIGRLKSIREAMQTKKRLALRVATVEATRAHLHFVGMPSKKNRQLFEWALRIMEEVLIDPGGLPKSGCDA
jgi:hypothetical protein